MEELKKKKYDMADKLANRVMVRALVASHPDLAFLLGCFDKEAEELHARNLASRRTDEDVEIVQMALDLTRNLIREAAIARKASPNV